MEENAQAIIEAARLSDKAQPIATVGAVQHWLIPNQQGAQVQKISLEAGLLAPMRKRGTVTVFDATSFNSVLAVNHMDGIAIYVDRDADNPKIVAVLNGNGEAGPGWGDFRAEIAFRFTPQWKKWRHIDGTMMPQTDFAEFIENNLADIVSPAGAEMLEIAQYLSAKRDVDFKSAIRLSSGQIQLQNLENINANVGAGQTAIPEMIQLGIAPVFGLPPFRIEARFRYRISDGKLKLGIKLQRIEDTMKAVVDDMVNGVVQTEGRMGTPGIFVPDNAIMVEGIAPPVTQ
jgi:uncharacterized protein YfdQ (DUF2303 family)